jgi:hypothetical protein
MFAKLEQLKELQNRVKAAKTDYNYKNCDVNATYFDLCNSSSN